MDAIDLLLQRNSAGKLAAPAPSEAELALMFAAAMRAPDHAWLRPWRFLLIEGAARERLGNLMVSVAGAEGDKADQLRAKALRAPVIVAVVVKLASHPKVPETEQYLSAACVAHGLLLAAEALGYAGIWRTGDFAYAAETRRGLGLADNERLVGFIYLGTRDGVTKPLPRPDWKEFVTRW
jgi:nitroreductase